MRLGSEGQSAVVDRYDVIIWREFHCNVASESALVTLYETAPRAKGKIVSVEVISLGADIDWGPVGKDRQGFMNIFPPKHSTLRLKCDARSTDPDLIVDYRWRRNGGYMGNNSQVCSY